MRGVLGIDAAWTSTQPSGVALVVERPDGWQLIAVASSYQHIQALADGSQTTQPRPSGSSPVACQLIAAAKAMCGRSVDLVAIDMPLARSPICGRRVADQKVSEEYGGRWCSTHSPSCSRPGQISDKLRKAFKRAGYPLRTCRVEPPCLIEVYPHPALVELGGTAKRLPYKSARIRQYWPEAAPCERRKLLYQTWGEIVKLLEDEIAGVTAKLPQLPDMNTKGVEVKAYEDALDAVICAWVAVCALEGRARPFGDDQSAIWIPRLAVSGDSYRLRTAPASASQP
jgi:predicted RNase H-like nuclease